jgi:hypothetical protein
VIEVRNLSVMHGRSLAGNYLVCTKNILIAHQKYL